MVILQHHKVVMDMLQATSIIIRIRLRILQPLEATPYYIQVISREIPTFQRIVIPHIIGLLLKLLPLHQLL